MLSLLLFLLAPNHTAIKLSDQRVLFPADQDHVLLGQHLSLSVNQDHLFICDPNENKILVLDQNGQFLQDLGQRGQGPGEWDQVLCVSTYSSGTMVLAYSGGRAHLFYFDKQHHFQKKKPMIEPLKHVLWLEMTPDLLYFQARQVTDTQVTFSWGLADQEKVLKTLATLPLTQASMDFNPESREQAINTAKEWFQQETATQAFAAFDADGHVFTAVSDKYQVKRFNQNLKELASFERSIKAKVRDETALIEKVRHRFLDGQSYEVTSMFSDTVMSTAYRKANVSARKPMIYGLRVTEGEVLVITDVDEGTGHARADVFSKKGTYLGIFEHPGFSLVGQAGQSRVAFKNHQMYALETIDEETRLLKYSYRREK